MQPVGSLPPCARSRCPSSDCVQFLLCISADEGLGTVSTALEWRRPSCLIVEDQDAMCHRLPQGIKHALSKKHLFSSLPARHSRKRDTFRRVRGAPSRAAGPFVLCRRRFDRRLARSPASHAQIAIRLWRGLAVPTQGNVLAHARGMRACTTSCRRAPSWQASHVPSCDPALCAPTSARRFKFWIREREVHRGTDVTVRFFFHTST